MDITEKKSCMDLTISAKLEEDAVDSSNSCFCFVELRTDENEWVELDKSELITMRQDLVWTKQFSVEYKFQYKQELRVTIFKIQEQENYHVGQVIEEVRNLLIPESQRALINVEAQQVGTLIIKSEESLVTKLKIIFELRAENLDDLDVWDQSDPYLKIYREGRSGWVLIHQTTTIFDNLNPRWTPAAMDYSHFCHCNPQTLLKIECYDWDSPTKSELIGEVGFMADDFKQGKVFTLTNANKLKKCKNAASGKIIVEQCNLVPEKSFIDHLREGMSINLTIGIDFTASNGLATSNSSLHYIQEGHQNEYEKALRILGSILSKYDSDQRFSLFGFGGKPQWIQPLVVNHSFALNHHIRDSFIDSFEGVIEFYKAAVGQVVLSGPTKLAPLIGKQLELISKSPPMTYHILLIFTDGEIDDMEETVEKLVEASMKPLSIVIVGVGFEDFEKLERLDGDQKALVNKKGEKCTRDIVQFVNYRKYKNNLEIFQREALMEIPAQMMNYMKYKNTGR